MLIVIPTYRRNHCLKWVLQSLVQCRTDDIPEPIRVLIVNNYPPAKEEIKVIVSEFMHEKRFLWNVLYREKTLPPVENWYSAILEWAAPDEVVIINSDDDLFLPWSLTNRFEEINSLRADILFAQLGSELYFSQDAERVYYLSELVFMKWDRAIALDLGQVFEFTPQHLSNHCYRNTELFRAGLAKSMSWCHAQDWLDFNNRTLYITLYLPYAILLLGGVVAGLRRKCIIRGRDALEIRKAKYGVPSWNHGFIHLCALGVLNNPELKDILQLDPIRSQYSDQFVRWFITCLWDSRVNRSELFETLRRIKFPISRLFSLKTLQGLELVIKDLLHLRGIRLQRACAQNSISTKSFMKRLAALPSR